MSDLSMQQQLCKYYEGQTPKEDEDLSTRAACSKTVWVLL